MDSLALYGAVVASLAFLVSGSSLGWQIYSWHRDRTTSVAVELYTRGERVTIRAINHSGHPIRIRRAELQLQDGSGEWVVPSHEVIPNDEGIPGVIPPHDSRFTWCLISEMEQAKFDLYEPFVARVVAGNGQRFRSEPFTIQPRPHGSR